MIKPCRAGAEWATAVLEAVLRNTDAHRLQLGQPPFDDSLGVGIQ